jgi:hypothetical protein
VRDYRFLPQLVVEYALLAGAAPEAVKLPDELSNRALWVTAGIPIVRGDVPLEPS